MGDTAAAGVRAALGGGVPGDVGGGDRGDGGRGGVAGRAGVGLLPAAAATGCDALRAGVSFNLTWPLFVAAGLLFAVLRTRLDREREASRLHRHTRSNQMELEASEVCGCIACERIYFPSEIVRWLEDGDGGVSALRRGCGGGVGFGDSDYARGAEKGS